MFRKLDLQLNLIIIYLAKLQTLGIYQELLEDLAVEKEDLVLLEAQF